jgi:hypothetical protein
LFLASWQCVSTSFPNSDGRSGRLEERRSFSLTNLREEKLRGPGQGKVGRKKDEL